jgi:G3E family GTPase
MNTAPHKHEINLSETTAYVYVSYGDTGITVDKWFHRFPSQRRLTRAARKAVLQHDSGSQRVQLIDQAQDVIRQEVRSDWYMDSEQRMTDLHRQALLEDPFHQSFAVVDFAVDAHGLKNELQHLILSDSQRIFVQKTLPEGF